MRREIGKDIEALSRGGVGGTVGGGRVAIREMLSAGCVKVKGDAP